MGSLEEYDTSLQPARLLANQCTRQPQPASHLRIGRARVAHAAVAVASALPGEAEAL